MKRALICTLLLPYLCLAQTAGIQQLFDSAVDAQQRGDYVEAVRDYRRVLQLQPDLADARANLGAALVHLGRFQEAVGEYRAALKAAPNNPGIRLNLALAYYKQGDFQQAATEFDRLRNSKAPKSQADDLRIATLVADCYSRLGDDARAIQLLKPLQPTDPGNLDLAYVLGSALVRTGNLREGLVLVEDVAKRGNSADAYLLAGSTLLKLNEKNRAMEDFDAAMRLNPNVPGLRTQVAIAKEGSGNLEGAESDLRKALELNPDDFEANIHLGGILYTRRDLDQARIYIGHALMINPSSLFALYERALIESAAGDSAAAISDLERVARGDPQWLDPHVQLSTLYYKLHRSSEGLRERKTVERLTAAGPGPSKAQ
jgi:tetratricopeptide (TPR) repeat protein